jgi:hypothetical protein
MEDPEKGTPVGHEPQPCFIKPVDYSSLVTYLFLRIGKARLFLLVSEKLFFIVVT